jgi:hypothetical protein
MFAGYDANHVRLVVKPIDEKVEPEIWPDSFAGSGN